MALHPLNFRLWFVLVTKKCWITVTFSRVANNLRYENILSIVAFTFSDNFVMSQISQKCDQVSSKVSKFCSWLHLSHSTVNFRTLPNERWNLTFSIYNKNKVKNLLLCHFFEKSCLYAQVEISLIFNGMHTKKNLLFQYCVIPDVLWPLRKLNSF